MKLTRYILLICCSLCLGSCEEVVDVLQDENLDGLEFNSSATESLDSLTYPSFYPEYNWDYVAVCQHLADGSGFDQTQAEFMASFPIVCLEKGQGQDTVAQGYADLGTFYAARQLKEINPDCKVLAYFSFNTDYGTKHSTGGLLYDPEELNPSGKEYYDATQTAYVTENDNIHPEYSVLKDGEYYYSSTNFRLLNHDYDDARNFLFNKMQDWLEQEPMLDGLFIDSYGASNKGDDTEGRQEGVVTLRNLIRDNITPTKIVLGNCVSSSENTSESDLEDMFTKLESVSGGMMEHFCILGGAPKENIASSIELISKVGKAGKMVVVKAWNRYGFGDDISHLSDEYLEQVSIEDIVFPLACFLCGAQKYAYFCYSWSYGYYNGGHIAYEEYYKKLGKPLGDYTRNNYIFTREFEHASVWADVENKEANIIWHEDLM